MLRGCIIAVITAYAPGPNYAEYPNMGESGRGARLQSLQVLQNSVNWMFISKVLSVSARSPLASFE